MEFKELLEEIIRRENDASSCTLSGISEGPCTKPGDNYMSEVAVVEVEGSLEGGPFQTSIFLKRLPDGAKRRKDFIVDVAFHNEVVMYQTILPLLCALTPSPFPRCYHAQRDLIVLQDLRRDGYKMADRRMGFDLNTAYSILKALAKFHALTFHLGSVKKEEFLKVTQLLQPIGLAASSSKDLVETSLQRVIKLVQISSDLVDVLPALRKFEGHVSKTLMSLRKCDNTSVLCHGDFWLNNIMIHAENVEHIRIVDLQTCQVLSPAVDVWTFLYTSLETSAMTSLDGLLSSYCECFLENLTDLNNSPEGLPVFTALKDELLSKELYGFLVATVYLPARYITPEVISKYNENCKQDNDELYEELFNFDMKDKMCDIVRLCKLRGLFKYPL